MDNDQNAFGTGASITRRREGTITYSCSSTFNGCDLAVPLALVFDWSVFAWLVYLRSPIWLVNIPTSISWCAAAISTLSETLTECESLRARSPE